ncbi:MAG: 50S ribosomal protein L16 [Parcubacteria group bacterium]|nr:50S ribosomal protein L16 [Parcubacteria group bacterium]
MLFPKKVKYRKWQTGRKNPKKVGSATRGNSLAFGSFGLKSMKAVRIRSNQIEAARRVISRAMGKSGRIWIRVFPDRPYTAKAAEVGMGKGKGDLQGYEFPVLPGHILFEVDGVDEAIAREALRKATAKLPLTAKVISR